MVTSLFIHQVFAAEPKSGLTDSQRLVAIAYHAEEWALMKNIGDDQRPAWVDQIEALRRKMTREWLFPLIDQTENDPRKWDLVLSELALVVALIRLDRANAVLHMRVINEDGKRPGFWWISEDQMPLVKAIYPVVEDTDDYPEGLTISKNQLGSINRRYVRLRNHVLATARAFLPGENTDYASDVFQQYIGQIEDLTECMAPGMTLPIGR
jgi:hypothetical protein